MHASLSRHHLVPRRVIWLAAGVVIAIAAAAAAAPTLIHHLHDDSRTDYLAADGWPEHGQAAYAIGAAPPAAGPGQRPVPVASLAKVMTALVVLRAAPLPIGGAGFTVTVSARDVADTARRDATDQSVVPVVAGERLTERDALAALLLPSANNVAVMLARKIAGSVPGFVARMNREARSFGMTETTYTDPSGFEASTVSTARDQLQLAQEAMLDPSFARLVATRSYDLPIAGTVRNSDTLLGTDGFVGIKTGSDDAAGGCFMFRSYRTIGSRRTAVTGVVLGQPGHNLILTGQYAARQLVDRIAPLQ